MWSDALNARYPHSATKSDDAGTRKRPRLIHRAIVGLIRAIPDRSYSNLSFKAYNKALTKLGSGYIGATYFDAQMECNLNDYIQRMIFHFGFWEPNVSSLFELILSPGDVFVDIGANVGYYSLLASRRVGAAGKVVAIEASPLTFAAFQRNLGLNPWATNVRGVNVAASDRRGKLDLYSFPSQSGEATTVQSRGGMLAASVDALPLTQILSVDELARVRLIKIDVEGGERTILHDLIENIGAYSATMDIVVEASPQENRGEWQSVFDRLVNAGFSVYAINNDYSHRAYLSWREPSPITRVTALPNEQQDLLFTRRPWT